MAQEEDKSQKTEQPTKKKLDDAAKRADVVKSQELSTFFVFISLILYLALLITPFVRALFFNLRLLLEHAASFNQILARESLQLFSQRLIGLMAMPMLLFVIIAILGNIIQHRLVFSFKPLAPKFSKISLIKGMGRLFSREALVNFAKGLIKILVVGLALAMVIWGERQRFALSMDLEIDHILPFVLELALELVTVVMPVVAVIAALDYWYQYSRWYNRQKMTKKELRDELKQVEGDPMTKSRLRSVRMAHYKRSLISQVPQASVVITNPHHYAVALKYDPDMPAPICLAKGKDFIALRIRTIAREHSLALVENKPLARSLYDSVEVGAEIAPEHYQAVAEIIGYVMTLNERKRWRGT